MIKIAFFDVDGTLLKMGHKELSERTLHALIYVTVGDEIIFKCPLDRMDKLQILQNLKDMHRAVAISNEHFIITNGTDPDLEQYFRFGNEMLKIDKQFDERVHEDIYQMMCSCHSTGMWEGKRCARGTSAFWLYERGSHRFWRWLQ